jgi:hypothetical protein
MAPALFYYIGNSERYWDYWYGSVMGVLAVGFLYFGIDAVRTGVFSRYMLVPWSAGFLGDRGGIFRTVPITGKLAYVCGALLIFGGIGLIVAALKRFKSLKRGSQRDQA